MNVLRKDSGTKPQTTNLWRSALDWTVLQHCWLIFFNSPSFCVFVLLCLRDSIMSFIVMQMLPVSCIRSVLHVVNLRNEIFLAGWFGSLVFHHHISPTAADWMRGDVTSWHSWGAQAGCNPEAAGWMGSEQPRVRWSSLWGSYRTDAHTDAWQTHEEHLTQCISCKTRLRDCTSLWTVHLSLPYGLTKQLNS